MKSEIREIKEIKILFSLLLIFLGTAISYLFLFYFSPLDLIGTYADPNNIPQIKLIILKAFLFITMSASISYLLLQFFKLKLRKILSVLITTLTGSILALFLSSPLYVPIGDYLRDYHGINWFFMDWGNFMITIVVYLAPVCSALILILFEKIIPKLLKKIKHSK